MASKLEFDIGRMQAFQNIVTTYRDQLISDKKNLQEYLKKLETDWNTDAGKKFFEEDLGEWESHVDTYVSLLDALDKMMSTAISEYTEVQNSAKGSSIHLS